jgi:hypothetical protein
VIFESLQKKKALRRGLDVARPTDILWTLDHPDVWLLVFGERVGDTIRAQLLRASPSRGD